MNKENVLTPVKRFFRLLKVDKQEVFSIYIYALFNGLVTLSIPLGIQAIINFLTVGEVSTSWTVLVVFVIIGVALGGVMQIMQLAITESLQQKIFTRSAFEFAYRIPRMRTEIIDKLYMPEMVNRFFDTLTVQKGLSKILIDLSTATLQIVFGLILLSLYHPFFILFSTILVIIVYFIFKITTPKGIITSHKESSAKYAVVHWLTEIARAKSAFKLSGNSSLPLIKTDEKVSDYLRQRKAHFKTLLLQYINLVGFKIVITAGLLFVGGLLVINQQMNIGQFVAAEIIILLVLASVEKLVLSMETIYDVLTAIEKIGSVTDIELENDFGKEIEFKDDDGISISIKDLSYRFKDSKVDILKNINLELESGKHLCIAGYNGSGKSFLLQIMAGLYDSYSGSITINKIKMNSLSKDNLRANIGNNIDKQSIFNGTLEENISLGNPEVTFEMMQRVIEVVSLSSFVESLEKGIHTVFLTEGKELPKSVRIKIMLARSIVGNPRLILLGDRLNQLSTEDKNRFLEYLFRNDKKWTVVVVSNDVKIAKKFDQVIVLDEGEIIGNDSFEMIKKQSWFNNIFKSK